MNPLKLKMTMKMKNLLWAALSMTAALVMTACSNDDNDMTEAPVAPSTSKTIPYTVTVGSGDATTRATVKDDPTDRQLYFATGDKLYITGTNIQGVLDLQDGVGASSNATFSGELTYTGGGSPASDLSLTATLVSAQQTEGTQVSVNAAGAVTVNYPDNAYCTSVNDAVQKYSNLTGTSTYSARAFTLTQQTAFLNFVITFEDGTATGKTLPAVVSNNSSTVCTANVTTATESEKVVAKFVLPVAAGTMLSSATVTMGSKAAISFGASQTLTGKVYNVRKTQAAPAGPTYPVALNEVTTSDYVGSVITSDGYVYAKKSDATAVGKTAVAIIAYVGTAGSVDSSSDSYKGLAIAMSDCGSDWMHWTEKGNGIYVDKAGDITTAIGYKNGIDYTNTLSIDGHTAAIAAASNNNTAAPADISGWFLPSMGQWNLILQGLATKKQGTAVTTNISYGGTFNHYTATNLNNVITAAGGTEFESNDYWSSTQYDEDDAWSVQLGEDQGSAWECSFEGDCYVRSALAF